jgi:hypothetical protein
MKNCGKKGRDFEKTPLNIKYKNFTFKHLQPKPEWLENRNSYFEIKDDGEFRKVSIM